MAVIQNTLLIELGTEELPPKSLKTLSQVFVSEILAGLLDQQLIDVDRSENATTYATPRRLAISVPLVDSAQVDQTIERRGPAIKAAFDDANEPTPAAKGFAKSCGVEVDQLKTLKTDKGEWLSYNVAEKGKTLAELLPSIINNAIKRLPIAKRMRWGDGNAEFVRPVHWLITLYGDSVLPCSVLDIESSNHTMGHRFHSQGKLTIDDANNYESILLEQGHVVANFDDRQSMILEQVKQLSAQVGGQIEPDQALLDEVTGLVEKPVAILGKFDDVFLDVPQECLISSMRDHQKYFHIKESNGNLLNKFITVSNIDSTDLDRVSAGNEKVLRARLSDAQFFWQTDLKTKLESRVKQLDNVLFHVELGSVGEKVKRIQALSKVIAEKISADATIAERGAELAKADLVSNMVGEFDELQGIMGKYYAVNDQEDGLVADCIEQHYWPKFAGDQLPVSKEAQAVALADKLDSLVGIFAAGEIPTGDKDPYALRRAALSILRILIEHKHNTGLTELVEASCNVFAKLQDYKINPQTQQDIVAFIRGRLTAHYQNQNIATATINAVMARVPDSPLDFDQRIQAVAEFNQLSESADLAAANKRIGNIIKKQSSQAGTDVDPDVFEESVENELYQAITTLEQDCSQLFDDGNYSLGLKKLATLRSPVDAFFEQVMVMSDDPVQQKNRLALLNRMQQLFFRVADISLLQ